MTAVLKLIDKIPMSALVVTAVLLTLAPLGAQPHLLEKLGMLYDASLTKPIDIFDLLMHATPLTLLVIRLLRLKRGEPTTKSS